MARDKYNYINTVKNETYVDLNLGDQANSEFLTPYMADVRKYATCNDALSTPIKDTYCYVTLRSKDNVPLSVFSKSAKKEKAVSVCKYTQCEVRDYGKELYNESFDKIFSYGFLSEDEVDKLADGDKSIKLENGKENLLISNNKPIGIHEDAVNAVMSRVVLRWLMGEEQVKIAVPTTEKNYNEYVLRAAKELYSYFPAALRCEVGFISYLSKDKYKDMPRVSIVFVPEEEADANTVFLDGSSEGVYRRLTEENALPTLTSFILHASKLSSEDDRREFVNNVFSDLEGSGELPSFKTFSPTRYSKYGKALGILDAEGDQQSKLASWIEFGQRGLDNLPKMEEKIWNKINLELNPEELKIYSLNSMEEIQDLNDKLAVIKDSIPMCKSREDCKKALWESFKSVAVSDNYKDEDVYICLAKNEKVWDQLLSSGDAENVKTEYAEKCASMVISEANAKLKALISQSPDLRDYRKNYFSIISAADEKASSILQQKDVKKVLNNINAGAYEYIVGKIKKDLDSHKVNSKTPSEMRMEITWLKEKQAELDPILFETKSYLALLNEFTQKIAIEQQKLASSGSQLQDLKKSIDGKANYFEAVKESSEGMEYLEANDQKELKRYLVEKRPKDFDTFCKAFKDYFEMKLSASNLIRVPYKMQNQIVEDIKGILESEKFSLRGETLTQITDYINSMISIATQFSPEADVKFTIGKKIMPASVLSKILNFTLEKGQASEDDVSTIVDELISKGIFNGSNLIALCRMFSNCGYYKMSMLTRHALAGDFKNCDKNTYKIAFSDMAKNIMASGKAKSLAKAYDVMSNIKNEHGSWNKEAKEALDKLKEETVVAEGRKKASKSVIVAIVLTVALVLSLAFGTLSTLTSLKQKKQVNELSNYSTSLEQDYAKMKDELLAAYGTIATTQIRDAVPVVNALIDTPNFAQFNEASESISLVKDAITKSSDGVLSEDLSRVFASIEKMISIAIDQYADENIMTIAAENVCGGFGSVINNDSDYSTIADLLENQEKELENLLNSNKQSNAYIMIKDAIDLVTNTSFVNNFKKESIDAAVSLLDTAKEMLIDADKVALNKAITSFKQEQKLISEYETLKAEMDECSSNADSKAEEAKQEFIINYLSQSQENTIETINAEILSAAEQAATDKKTEIETKIENYGIELQEKNLEIQNAIQTSIAIVSTFKEEASQELVTAVFG